jgi:hypothetical protein
MGRRTPEGYVEHPFDRQIEDGIRTAFNQTYRGVVGDPDKNPLAKHWYSQFRAGALKAIHNPNGELDQVQAAKVLYPNQPQQQERHARVVPLVMQINDNLEEAMKSSNGLLSPLGGVSRYFAPERNVAYNAVKRAVSELAGGSADVARMFDQIMAAPTRSGEQKSAMIRDLVNRLDPYAGQLIMSSGATR